MASRHASVVVEGLEGRTLMSGTHPVRGAGGAFHEFVGPTPYTVLGSVTLPAGVQAAGATVRWGDGTSTGAGLSTTDYNTDVGVFSNAAHTYAKAGTYRVTVDVTAADGTVVGTIHDRATVTPNVTRGSTVRAAAGRAATRTVGLYDGTVDAGATVSIDWGDGTASPATLVKRGRAVLVRGTHTYATAGRYATAVKETAGTSFSAGDDGITVITTGTPATPGDGISGAALEFTGIAKYVRLAPTVLFSSTAIVRR